MRVIVTGGAGFIGSHVVDELVRRDYQVVVIDSLLLGNIRYIKGLIDEEAIEFYGTEVRHIIHKLGRADVVIHLGQPSSSPMYLQNEAYIKDVIHDMLSILEWATRYDARVILGSTSSLYNTNPIPWRENMPIHVTDFYTEAKYFCERLCELYAKREGVECIALRFFSVFGEREEHKGVYANLLTQLIWCGLRGDTFYVYGDGKQSRDLIYVKDVVTAIVKAIEFDDWSKIHKFEVFNVGSGFAYSVRDMVKLLSNFGLNVKIRTGIREPQFYIRHTLADTTKAKEKLGFEPRYSVPRVIPQLIEYYGKIMRQ